jgi:hypothetical protein
MKASILPLSIVLLSLPLLAAKPFKDTSEYRDAKELKGYLNVKLDTYARMYKEPKGTDCDWVMVDPTFNLDDLRKEPVTFFPDSISRNGGWDASYWGMYGGWYSNGLVTTFESALRTRGINLQRPANSGGAATTTPMNPYQMAIANAYGVQGMQPPQPQQAAEKPKATEPPALTPLQQRIEMDRYDEDKKALGVEEAAKRAEARETKRVQDWKTAQAIAGSEAAEAAKSKNPEDLKGFVCVLYITESKVNTGAAMWIPFVPVTNSTTGEFVLLHDGKPVLAGRHNSVGAYTDSAPKCGNALATAFDIKMVSK